MPESEDNKRDCSLPPGCKDLIDVIRSQPAAVPDPLPSIARRVTLPEYVAVRYLAEILGADRAKMVKLMREARVGGSWDRQMSFGSAEWLLRRQGIGADKES